MKDTRVILPLKLIPDGTSVYLFGGRVPYVVRRGNFSMLPTPELITTDERRHVADKSQVCLAKDLVVLEGRQWHVRHEDQKVWFPVKCLAEFVDWLEAHHQLPSEFQVEMAAAAGSKELDGREVYKLTGGKRYALRHSIPVYGFVRQPPIQPPEGNVFTICHEGCVNYTPVSNLVKFRMSIADLRELSEGEFVTNGPAIAIPEPVPACPGCGGRGYWFDEDQQVVCLACPAGQEYQSRIDAGRRASP